MVTEVTSKLHRGVLTAGFRFAFTARANQSLALRRARLIPA